MLLEFVLMYVLSNVVCFLSLGVACSVVMCVRCVGSCNCCLICDACN